MSNPCGQYCKGCLFLGSLSVTCAVCSGGLKSLYPYSKRGVKIAYTRWLNKQRKSK